MRQQVEYDDDEPFEPGVVEALVTALGLFASANLLLFVWWILYCVLFDWRADGTGLYNVPGG